MVNQALLAKSKGVPVSCLGFQAHYQKDELPSPAGTWVRVNSDGVSWQSIIGIFFGIQKRLDELAATGLKLWATELDFKSDDINRRAEGYDRVLRLYFSHPAVHGVIIWGPWNMDNGKQPISIVDGNNFQVSLDCFIWRCSN